MREVQIDPMSLERLAHLLDAGRAELLRSGAAAAQQLLDGRVVWNVNATAAGGGVAEMLQTLLAYSRGAGVDARWLVLDGNAEFFRITKRLHNVLHGSPGDGGPLAEEERSVYDATLAENTDALSSQVKAGDLVLLHDPQTAGLAEPLRAKGAHVVWRCHIGRDTPTALTDVGWEFLRPYITESDAVIFSRDAYVPDWVDRTRLEIIPPSLDPFSAKNVDLRPLDVDATLSAARLVDRDGSQGSLGFGRRDGSSGTVRPHENLFAAGGIVPGDARIVMQVSRWDRLKDMTGVLTAFTDNLTLYAPDVHLVLVGPDVFGVSDDPEGAEVLDECVHLWKALPAEARARVHLVALPMDDVDENAHLVNALQRHASVVVQKSLVEGFGLTVTEPMWKGRPMVASRVGGIQDQVVHGETGLLLADPTDLDEFAALVATLLDDPGRAERFGTAARERVRDRFLGDRHLLQYASLFHRLLQDA